MQVHMIIQALLGSSTANKGKQGSPFGCQLVDDPVCLAYASNEVVLLQNRKVVREFGIRDLYELLEDADAGRLS